MPHFDGSRHSQDSERQSGNDVKRVGDRDQPLAIETVGEHAAEESEDD
jgi:hypothetical protein